jgi:hypothetical protein
MFTIGQLADIKMKEKKRKSTRQSSAYCIGKYQEMGEESC